MPLFLAIIFASAGLVGLILIAYNYWFKNRRLYVKSIPFGFTLGIVNYGSMYFLLKALRVEGFETSTIFTINNVAIVAISCMVGLVLFKEWISKNNWVGIIIALISIVLVTL